MKISKLGLVALSFALVGGLAACTNDDKKTDNQTTDVSKPVEGEALSYAEYMATKDGEEVTIKGYVQAKQGWWEDKATIYLQDNDGGYFAYQLPCTKEEYDTDLAIGNHIEITGIKGSWSGMVEILGSEAGAEATFKKLDGTKIYDPKKITDLNPDNLVSHISSKVAIDGLTVVNVNFPKGYGGDIEYVVTDGVNLFTFYVESYLTGKDTDVYKEVASLKVGEVVNVEGFMYVYNGPQLHTTKCTKTGVNVLTKSEGSLTYDEFLAAPMGDTITIEAFIQGKQAYDTKKEAATLYLADADGAYFAYSIPCTEEQYNNDLKLGNKVKITGQKADFSGMVEIRGDVAGNEGTYELLDGKYLSLSTDVSKDLSKDNLVSHLSQKVSIENLVVKSVTLPVTEGDDIAYDVTDGIYTYTFYVETALTNKDTDVYKTVLALKPGDLINVEGFMYFYDEPQLHTTKCTLGNNMKKSEGALSYDEYIAAEKDTKITIEAFIQGIQRDEANGIVNLYLADELGSYFAYGIPCTKEEYKNFNIGRRINITGQKAIWNGLHEIMCSVEGAEGSYKFVGKDKFYQTTKNFDFMFDNPDLIKYAAKKMEFTNLTVTEVEAPNSENGDFAIKVTNGTTTLNFYIETTVIDVESQTYKTAKELKAGDKLDLEGFMYIFNGPQLHITNIKNLKKSA